MTPDIFDGKNIIVQGITGAHGSFHAAAMRAAGTNVVAGTSPNKAGERVDGMPVYKTVKDIQADFIVDASVIFVPAPHARGAIFEAIDANVPLIVCITEHIPVHDMMAVKRRLADSSSVLIGPNCPGVLLPGKLKLGIIPAGMGLPGSIGIVSRSGTLTYEAMAGLSARGKGQKYVVGIGGDRVHGAGFIDCLELFERDSAVDQIVLIGEIGGNEEILAADFIKENISKPVYSYIAGHHAPTGVRLGHAGAILEGESESAAAKTAALKVAGVRVADTITQLIASVS